MATTRIMPLHTGKGRTESQAVSDIIDYVANPQKTDNGRLVTGFACDSRVSWGIACHVVPHSGTTHALRRLGVSVKACFEQIT